jgi:hypothetical protein
MSSNSSVIRSVENLVRYARCLVAVSADVSAPVCNRPGLQICFPTATASVEHCCSESLFRWSVQRYCLNSRAVWQRLHNAQLVTLPLLNSYSSFVHAISQAATHSYFGVLHPVSCMLSRLLEEPPLATAFQGVYFIFFAATCFGPCWPSSCGIHNYFRKLLHT